MNLKGQIAFESLLVILVVITSASLVVPLYLQFHDETAALGYARIGALEELSKQNENIIIEKISLTKVEQDKTITIFLSQFADINKTRIENTIKENTPLQNIQIQVIQLRQ